LSGTSSLLPLRAYFNRKYVLQSLIYKDQANNNQLNCCGYLNSTSPPFVVDKICPIAQVAASMVACVKPFSTYANNFLDTIFTGAFGIVGIDAFLILTIAMLLKDRKEKERYRHIDEKSGARGF
jgi:hypothetical protein